MHEHLFVARQQIRQVGKDLKHIRFQALSLEAAARFSESTLARVRMSVDSIEAWYRNEGVVEEAPKVHLLRDGPIHPTPPPDTEEPAARPAGGGGDAFDEESYGPMLEASRGVRVDRGGCTSKDIVTDKTGKIVGERS